MSQFQQGPGQSPSDPPQQPNTDYPQWQQPSLSSPLPQQPFQQYPPVQQYQQPLPPQPTPKKPTTKHRLKRRTWFVIAGILGFIIVVSAIANGTNGTSSQPATTPTKQTTQASIQPTQAQTTKPATTPTPAQTTKPAITPTPVQTPKPTPSFLTFGDGTYQVGKDIQPGTYRTTVGSPGCYYERLSGFGGTVSDIIANNNTDFPAIVTILATDKGFDAQNCGTWTTDLSQITTSQTTFDDGMYIVGTDIIPGTYKNSGGATCYYARLSGFSNTTDDIIANNNVSTPAIITIAPSDKGFESQGCGTWTKL